MDVLWNHWFWITLYMVIEPIGRHPSACDSLVVESELDSVVGSKRNLDLETLLKLANVKIGAVKVEDRDVSLSDTNDKVIQQESDKESDNHGAKVIVVDSKEGYEVPNKDVGSFETLIPKNSGSFGEISHEDNRDGKSISQKQPFAIQVQPSAEEIYIRFSQKEEIEKYQDNELKPRGRSLDILEGSEDFISKEVGDEQLVGSSSRHKAITVDYPQYVERTGQNFKKDKNLIYLLGLGLGGLTFILIVIVLVGVLLSRNRWKPKSTESMERSFISTESYAGSITDSSDNFSSINYSDCAGIEDSKFKGSTNDDLYNLDNDSFLNSLETITSPLERHFQTHL